MRETIDDLLARRHREPDGLRRAMSWSFGVHVAAIALAVLLPRHWFLTAEPEPILMSISLGGSPGERSGGMAAAGARPVERAVPDPPRPTPIPSVQPPKSTPEATTAAAKPATKPTPTPGPPSATPDRPPTTGPEVTKGTAAADTGSKTQGTGLTFGGGQGGAQITLDSQFCCPDYVQELLRRIGDKWTLTRNAPESGETVVRFEIRRDGSFATPTITKSTSRMLELASLAAFRGLVLPPLPAQFQEDRLVVNLTFPYKEQPR